MDNFQFKTVPHIIFETDITSRLADILFDKFGALERVAIVTDKQLVQLGLLTPMLQALKTRGVSLLIYDEVLPDPSESSIILAANRAKEFGAQAVIGFGGGSPMDTAKLVAALLGSEQPISQMYGVDKVSSNRLPLALVPTTAGTGSEVTHIAIVTVDDDKKLGISSSKLFADLAVLDARLTVRLPSNITAATGIDAMVHAIEAFTSRHLKNPMSDMVAKKALKLIHSNLEKCCLDGQNIKARESVLLGAMLAGQAFTNAPVAAVHALAYPIGARFHIPHGLSNSLVLPSVLKFNARAAEAQYAELAAHIGLAANSHALTSELQRIAKATGLSTRLRDVNIPESALPTMAKDVTQNTRLMSNNPADMNYDDILKCYREVY